MIPRWVVERLAERVRGAEGSRVQGAEAVKDCAKRYGVSRATVYRRLQRLAGKKPGLRISRAERQWASELAGYVHATMNKKGIAIATETAIQELERMGRIPAGVWKRQRADVVLRALGLTKRHFRKPRPCVRLSAPGSNTWHEVDFTVSAAFYLENMWPGKGKRGQSPGRYSPRFPDDRQTKAAAGLPQSIVRVESEFRKVKRADRTKVMIGCCTDVFSRCAFARAYEARGESAELAVQFLYDAWKDKGDPGFPFHGVPWNAYSDQGPGFKAGPVQILLDHLFVDWTGHKAGNSRATGAVERKFLDTARFEALMRGRLACGHNVTLVEFNSWLHEMCVNLNNRKHPIFKDKTRFEVWQSIAEEDIRQCPEWDVFVNLTAVGEMKRKVTPYMTISLSGKLNGTGETKEYFLGVPDLVGEVVDVYLSADKKVWARFEDRVYGPLTDSVPVNVLGADVRQAPLTASEKNIKEAVAAARRIGVRKTDLAYVRGEDSGMWVPRKGRKIGRKAGVADMADLGEDSAGKRGQSPGRYSPRFPSPFSTCWEAKNWLVQQGLDIAGMSPSEKEVLDGALEELLERDGVVTVATLEEIAGAVVRVTK